MYLNAKDCESYYCSQVGGGGVYFQGIPHQRGYGFFGDLRRYISPLAIRAGRYLGRHLLQAGKNVITDVASGSSFKESAKNRLKETSKKIQKDIFEKIQRGQGIKRKHRKKPHHSKVKRRRTSQDIFT